MDKNYSLVSLFCGAGGLDMYFEHYKKTGKVNQ